MDDLKKEYSKYRSRQSLKKHVAKRKVEDIQGYYEKENKRKREHEERKKKEDPEGFKAKVNERKKKQETKEKVEDLKSFKEKRNKKKRAHNVKKKNEDPEKFKAKGNEWKRKSSNNVNAAQRLIRFKQKVQYGPIFVCSCCEQKLFENQVKLLTDELRKTIDEVDPGIREHCIEEEIEVEIGNEKYTYLCNSCLTYLKKGKLPKLCVKNGLEVDKIEEDSTLNLL